MDPLTCIAVDWSGARIGAEKRIWLAEARAGALLRLENGRTAAQIARELVEAADRAPRLVVGLDFAFSFPGWFLTEHGLEHAWDLWAKVAAEGEHWLAACAPPFWGRPSRPRPAGDLQRGYRQAELALPFRPKSVFQVGGAGSVGTGSIRGMPTLLELRCSGFSVWPFDDPTLPVVLEIYPRLLTGAVVKSSADARARYIAARHPSLPHSLRALTEESEDAFDAAISALAMSEHAQQLAALPICINPEARREGLIWHPSLPHSPLPSAVGSPPSESD